VNIVGLLRIELHVIQVGSFDPLDHRAQRLARRGRSDIDELHHFDLPAGIIHTALARAQIELYHHRVEDQVSDQ
jgi:hypothetical protein